MNRRGAGVGFIGLAVFLFVSKNLIAAIFGSEMNSYTDVSFKALLSIMDSKLDSYAIFFAILGILYIIWSEIEEEVSKKKSKR